MIKSSENYQRNLKHKVSLVQNTIRRHSVNNNNSFNYSERLGAIISKQKSADYRRNKIKKEFYNKVNAKEQKFNEKINKARNLNFENTIKNYNQEKKSKISEFFQQIKDKQRDHIESKQERHKVQEEIAQNLNKQKNIESIKKQKILEKHKEIHKRRIQENFFLELVNERVREKAMNFTKEREKLLEIKAKISKSQNPDKIKKILIGIKDR